jgi:iron-sulfur cluster assembly protein
MSITLTRRAAERVRGLLRRRNVPDALLRVAVRQGGCAGLCYALDVTDAPAPEDETFACHGVRLICDPKSYARLRGTEIDYDETFLTGGFVFHNPNARNVCNCGSSFSV